jgi:ATP-dependent helicase/nuclease subunit A
VALTRAEKWLIVAAAGKVGEAGESWYRMVESAMQDGGAVECDLGGQTGLRLHHGDWDGLPLVVPPTPETVTHSLPELFRQPAAPYLPPAAALSPSDLGGAKALPGDQGLDEAAAKARGSRLHLLLEHLPGQPPQDWPQLAQNLLQDAPDSAALLAEAQAVLTQPSLAPVFAKETLAEVPISADLDGQRLHGVIDRLIVSPDRVLAVDFKTNATVPQSPQHCPDGLLRQMGAYAHALAQIYPDRVVDTALLWTRTATLMPLPHDLVTAALQRYAEP